MKTMFILLSFLITTGASASCRSVFVGGFGSLTIANPPGGSDDDATRLWNALDIPSQNSSLGPGKPMVSSGKEINFICVDRGGNGKQMTCTITFNPMGPKSGAWTRIDSISKKIHFQVEGSEAAFFTEKWHTQQGEFRYKTEDGKFSLLVSPGRVEIEFADSGL